MKTQEQVFREALIAVLPALRRYCFALTNSRPDGEDLLQASVEKALSRWQQFTPGTDMDRWMYRLCRNHWIDTVRAQRPQEEFEDDMMPDHEHHNPEALTLSQRSLEQLQQRIGQLSESLRMVLYLVAVEGRSYQETADILDIPTGTVMSRLARARTRLADAAE